MTQVNFKITPETNEFLELMAKEEKKSKAAISKLIFMDGLNNQLLPYLAKLYQVGKISIKNIAKITGLHHTEVITKIASLIDDIYSNLETDEYTELVRKKFTPYLKSIAQNQGISFKDSINE